MPMRPPIHSLRRQGASTHDAAALRDPALAGARQIRSSARWQHVRAHFLRAHPLCSDPFRDHLGAVVPAELPHHIQPVARRPDLAFVEENLAGLCQRCHARVESMERAGVDTSPFFARRA